MASRSRQSRSIPIHRRSRSAHQPYHSITETYMKEVTSRPLATQDDANFPETIYVTDDDQGRYTPPLVRTREYPVFRVDNSPSRVTETFKETLDYEEYGKFPKNLPNPTFNIIPPSSRTKSSDPGTRPKLPMYEEYLMKKPRIDENHNPPIARNILENAPKSPQKAPRGNFRHIDSSDSSDNGSKNGEVEKSNRFVYSHDVFVDSESGRPFTPGRNDIDAKNCGKLKINVYFKPPRPPVLPTYTLDEIEIEKSEENRNLPLSHSSTVNSSSKHSMHSIPRSIPSRYSILKKESEIFTVPLNFEKDRQSRTSTRTSRSERYESKVLRSSERIGTPSERNIPIRIEESSVHMDELFPKMPRKSPSIHEIRKDVADRASTRSSTRPVEPLYPNQNELTKNYPLDRNSTRSTFNRNPIENLYPNKSEVPENYPLDRHSTRSTVHPKPIELHYPMPSGARRTSPFDRSSTRSSNHPKPIELHYPMPNHPKPIDLHYPMPNEASKNYPSDSTSRHSSFNRPKIQYNYPKPPSVRDNISEEKPTNYERPSFRPNNTGGDRPKFDDRKETPKEPRPNPTEEVIHVKERYERDETIHRFYPTTTSV